MTGLRPMWVMLPSHGWILPGETLWGRGLLEPVSGKVGGLRAAGLSTQRITAQPLGASQRVRRPAPCHVQ